MTQSEFLSGLKEALANDLSGSIIQDNVEYYRNYIIEEKKKGRNEQEVIDELGDPWVIARTIIDSAGSTGNAGESYSYEPKKQSYRQEQSGGQNNVHVFGFQAWWKKLLLVLGIIGVFAIIIGVIGGIFSLIAPILVPLVLVVFVIRIFSGGRR